jgi:hypothetical protein
MAAADEEFIHRQAYGTSSSKKSTECDLNGPGALPRNAFMGPLIESSSRSSDHEGLQTTYGADDFICG